MILPTQDRAVLVCPYDLGPLSADRDASVVCGQGHRFAVHAGIADLVLAEATSAYLHHVPGDTTTYEDSLRPGRGGRRPGRLALALDVVRAARFYRTTVQRAWRLFPRDLATQPLPGADGFRRIHGDTMFTHEVTKRLEKELFWDDVELPAPACELGIHSGESSRYFFGDRALQWGSNYVPSTMQRPREDYPHRGLFAANIKFLPFVDGSLASLCCSQTLTVAYASIGSILAEVNRVLALGGRFAFVTHGPAFRWALPRDGWPEMGLSALACQRRIAERSSYMAHLYTMDEWGQLLQAHGFDVEFSRGLLSSDHARFVQLFYAQEMILPPVFTARYHTPRMRLVKALAGLTPAREAVAVSRLNTMMGAIVAHELDRHRGAPFDDTRFFDAGIVAVKRRESGVHRLVPRPRAAPS
ncbi:MAG TPA: hypothetical protein VFK10_00610 [Burkholderiaceae bacterium]|nr:hypothetical protein [Burkholderiaceae bacterium]